MQAVYDQEKSKPDAVNDSRSTGTQTARAVVTKRGGTLISGYRGASRVCHRQSTQLPHANSILKHRTMSVVLHIPKLHVRSLISP